MKPSQKNQIGMTLAEYNTLKLYFSGTHSIEYAYKIWKQGVNIRQIISDNIFLDDLNKTIYTKGVRELNKKVPRENVSIEDIKPKQSKTKFNSKEYTNRKMWESILSNPKALLGKPYIINFHSDIGEQGLMASSYFISELKKDKSLKINIMSGVELGLTFKDFSEYGSIPKLVKYDVLAVFSSNSVAKTDWNVQKWEELLSECSLKNTLLVLSSKKPFESKDYTVINVGFTDDKSNEVQLIKDLGLD